MGRDTKRQNPGKVNNKNVIGACPLKVLEQADVMYRY